MNTLTAILSISLLIFIMYRLSYSQEAFWGGYMGVPYAGQKIVRYGRTGVDAATDAPKMLIDLCAHPINPAFCSNCTEYRCC